MIFNDINDWVIMKRLQAYSFPQKFTSPAQMYGLWQESCNLSAKFSKCIAEHQGLCITEATRVQIEKHNQNAKKTSDNKEFSRISHLTKYGLVHSDLKAFN